MIQMRNVSNQIVEIVRWESSCFCVELPEVPLLFNPSQSHTVAVRVDLAREPNYSGLLRVEVRGYDATGNPALVAWVELNVVT